MFIDWFVSVGSTNAHSSFEHREFFHRDYLTDFLCLVHIVFALLEFTPSSIFQIAIMGPRAPGLAFPSQGLWIASVEPEAKDDESADSNESAYTTADNRA